MCGTYLLASSLAAALLNGLFEHPAWWTPVIPDVQISEIQACPESFSAAY
jgi:Tfp pilus assembly protein PilO